MSEGSSPTPSMSSENDPRSQIIGIDTNATVNNTLPEKTIPKRIIFQKIRQFILTTTDGVKREINFEDEITCTIYVIPPKGDTEEEMWNNFRGIQLTGRNIDVMYIFLDEMSKDKSLWNKKILAWKCDEPEGQEMVVVDVNNVQPTPKVEEITEECAQMSLKGKEKMSD
jgi:hypothetical protein